MPGYTWRGWPYPTGTDPFSEGHNQIKSLANALDRQIAGYVVRPNDKNSEGTTAADGAIEFDGANNPDQSTNVVNWVVPSVFGTSTRMYRVSYSFTGGGSAEQLQFHPYYNTLPLSPETTFDSQGFGMKSNSITTAEALGTKYAVINFGTDYAEQYGEFIVIDAFSATAPMRLIHTGGNGMMPQISTSVMNESRSVNGFSIERPGGWGYNVKGWVKVTSA